MERRYKIRRIAAVLVVAAALVGAGGYLILSLVQPSPVVVPHPDISPWIFAEEGLFVNEASGSTYGRTAYVVSVARTREGAIANEQFYDIYRYAAQQAHEAATDRVYLYVILVHGGSRETMQAGLLARVGCNTDAFWLMFREPYTEDNFDLVGPLFAKAVRDGECTAIINPTAMMPPYLGMEYHMEQLGYVPA